MDFEKFGRAITCFFSNLNVHLLKNISWSPTLKHSVHLLCSMRILFLLLMPSILLAQSRQSANQYIEKYKDIAIIEMQRYGIPASIKLGQGILESSSGNSDLAKEANNHFGIKCKKDWTGPAFYKDDDAKDECFRKYDNVLASYEDHSQFLKNGQRYAFLFEFEKDDYKAWAHGLKKAGYATNPQYAHLLIKTIEENRLFQFDTQTIVKGDVPPPITKRKRVVDEEVPEISIAKRAGREVFQRNRVKYVLAHDGDTPESLAKELDLMLWQIPKYNDFESSSLRLIPGQVVYIQPKRRKGETKSHVVKEGETLQSISQQYAIKLKNLRKLNLLLEGDSVKVEQELKLK